MQNTNQYCTNTTTLCNILGASGWVKMDMQSSSAKPYLVLFLSFLVTLLALSEQIWYLKKKSHLPGPSIIVPFLGNAISLVRSPTKFWDDQASFAKSGPSGLSVNFIFGRFILFVRSTELSQKIFANVRPDAFLLIGHPFGKKLFGQHNLIYLTGDPHKDLRRRIAPNFTPRALATYTALQQRILLRHLLRWTSSSSPSATAPTPLALRFPCRDLNLETSQSVFVGPYLSNEERDRFNADYNLFNVGLMALPIDLPGLAFREARLAVDRLVDKLTACARKSRARMARGEDPECLIDFWMQGELRDPASEASKLETSADGDAHFGSYLFDFLFAAQDASTSSLLWAVALLDSHRDVLARVRDEVAGVWSPDSDDLITTDQLREMRYTEAVAREILRFRPPATLVPHVAAVDFPLTESYTVPRGTIVFPSVLESSLQGFTDPERFDPDRFSADRLEDRVYKRNYLVFGTGAHQCVGQRYALNHLVLFLAMFTSLVDFRRHGTDGCDEIAYVPTICPRDDCTVFLSPRCARYPSFPAAETLK